MKKKLLASAEVQSSQKLSRQDYIISDRSTMDRILIICPIPAFPFIMFWTRMRAPDDTKVAVQYWSHLLLYLIIRFKNSIIEKDYLNLIIWWLDAYSRIKNNNNLKNITLLIKNEKTLYYYSLPKLSTQFFVGICSKKKFLVAVEEILIIYVH